MPSLPSSRSPRSGRPMPRPGTARPGSCCATRSAPSAPCATSARCPCSRPRRRRRWAVAPWPPRSPDAASSAPRWRGTGPPSWRSRPSRASTGPDGDDRRCAASSTPHNGTGLTNRPVLDAAQRTALIARADLAEQSHPDATYRVERPANHDLLDHDLWLVVEDADGDPLLLCVVPTDGPWRCCATSGPWCGARPQRRPLPRHRRPRRRARGTRRALARRHRAPRPADQRVAPLPADDRLPLARIRLRATTPS